MSLDIPLAHLGHWYLWIPYVIPVLVVLGDEGGGLEAQRLAVAMKRLAH